MDSNSIWEHWFWKKIQEWKNVSKKQCFQLKFHFMKLHFDKGVVIWKKLRIAYFTLVNCKRNIDKYLWSVFWEYQKITEFQFGSTEISKKKIRTYNFDLQLPQEYVYLELLKFNAFSSMNCSNVVFIISLCSNTL